MIEINFDTNKNKISRILPQYWENADKDDIYTNSIPNALLAFAQYSLKMIVGLTDIKRFYYSEFNKDNSYSINDYIEIFDSLLDQANKILLKR